MRTVRLAVFGLACVLSSACSSNCPSKISGTVSVTGRSDASGTQLTLAPEGQTTQTDAAGAYSFSCVPAGKHSLQFSNQGHSDVIPDVETSSGGLTEVVDMSFYPLSAFELAPGTRLQTLSDPAGTYFYVIQSADGESVSFVSSIDGGKLYHSNLATGVSETVVTGQISSEGFSADGQWLFWVENGTLKVRLASGGDPTTLQTSVNGVAQSGDRRYLAYADSSSTYLLTLGTTTATNLGPRIGSCSSGFDGTFAFDGSLVWYSGASNQACEPQTIHVASPGGDPQQTIAQAVNPTLSADARWLVYTVGACGGPSEGCGNFDVGTLMALKIGATAPVSIGAGGGLPGIPAVFSSDDTKVIYASTAGDVVVAHSDGSGSQTLATGADSCHRVYGFSPDGQFELFEQQGASGCELLASNDGAAAIPLGTGLGNRVVNGICTYPCSDSWGYFGSSAVFLDGVTVPNGPARLELASLDSGAVTTLATGVTGSVLLTPDGSKALFSQSTTGNDGDLFWLDLANPTPVKVGGTGYVGALSPDGSKASVFTNCAPTCSVSVVEMQNGKATLIAQNATAALWGPASDVLAVVSGELGQPGEVTLSRPDGTGSTEVLSSGELVTWLDAHRLLAQRSGVEAPYRFQNGLYLFSWP